MAQVQVVKKVDALAALIAAGFTKSQLRYRFNKMEKEAKTPKYTSPLDTFSRFYKEEVAKHGAIDTTTIS
jgi:hypothetical protein